MNSDTVYNYVLGHDMRAENPLHTHLTAMFSEIAERTGGRLKVEIVPWGGVGSSKIALRKLLDNEIQIHPISGMPLSTVVPIAGMEGLPYAFASEDEACRILDGAFGDLLRSHIAKLGLHVSQHIWWQGFNQISTSTGPLRHAQDLDGFKLRIAQVPYKQELFSALGCDPQQIHYQAIYDNLKSGAASGEETPYLYIELDKFAEVQTHLAVTNHRFASFWLCFNQQAWAALPEDIRAIVSDAEARHVMDYRRTMVKENAAACERLKERLVFNEADTASFVERLKRNGFYERARRAFGEEAWTLLERERGAAYP